MYLITRVVAGDIFWLSLAGKAELERLKLSRSLADYRSKMKAVMNHRIQSVWCVMKKIKYECSNNLFKFPNKHMRWESFCWNHSTSCSGSQTFYVAISIKTSKYTRHQLSWGVWAAVGRVSSVPSQTCLKEESSQGKVTEGSSHEHSCSCCCFLWVVCKSGSKSHLCNETWEQQIIHCLNCLWLRFDCKLGRIAAWWGRSELGSSTTARVAPVMHLRK